MRAVRIWKNHFVVSEAQDYPFERLGCRLERCPIFGRLANEDSAFNRAHNEPAECIGIGFCFESSQALRILKEPDEQIMPLDEEKVCGFCDASVRVAQLQGEIPEESASPAIAGDNVVHHPIDHQADLR